MKPRSNQPDLGAGLLFIAVGLVAAIGSFRYRVGAASDMGPGYFPLILGLLLAVAGLVTVLRAWRASPLGIAAPGVWQSAWVIGGIAVFGLTVETAGLLLSTLLLVVMCRVGSRDMRWREVLAYGLLLALSTAAVFIGGLHLMLPVLPDFSRFFS